MKVSLFALFILASHWVFGISSARADSLFNLSGSLHGFGDVVGPYLLAKQAARNERLYLLIDDRAEKVLRTYLELGEKPLESTPDMKFIRAEELAHLPPLNRFYETFRGARAGLRTSEIESRLKTPPKITLIAHDLHSPYGRDSLPESFRVSGWSEVRSANQTLYFSAAGLGKNRVGILDDESIRPFLQVSPERQRELAASRFEPESLVSKILLSKRFAGADLSFAYGVHNEAFNDGSWRGYPGQLSSFAQGLEKIARKKSNAIVVFSPNTKSVLETTLGMSAATSVFSLNELASLSHLAAGRVYLVSTGALSSSQFVALTAASNLPYMIEGDSALSAAVRLAKPFVMLKGPWGLFGVDGLSHGLTESGASWAAQVYPVHETPGRDTPDFSSLEAIANDKAAFTNLAQNARSWSESIETILSYAEGKLSKSELFSRIHDPLLKASVTQVGAPATLKLLNVKKRMSACQASF